MVCGGSWGSWGRIWLSHVVMLAGAVRATATAWDHLKVLSTGRSGPGLRVPLDDHQRCLGGGRVNVYTHKHSGQVTGHLVPAPLGGQDEPVGARFRRGHEPPGLPRRGRPLVGAGEAVAEGVHPEVGDGGDDRRPLSRGGRVEHEGLQDGGGQWRATGLEEREQGGGLHLQAPTVSSPNGRWGRRRDRASTWWKARWRANIRARTRGGRSGGPTALCRPAMVSTWGGSSRAFHRPSQRVSTASWRSVLAQRTSRLRMGPRWTCEGSWTMRPRMTSLTWSHTSTVDRWSRTVWMALGRAVVNKQPWLSAQRQPPDRSEERGPREEARAGRHVVASHACCALQNLITPAVGLVAGGFWSQPPGGSWPSFACCSSSGMHVARWARMVPPVHAVSQWVQTTCWSASSMQRTASGGTSVVWTGSRQHGHARCCDATAPRHVR